jgi:hypothetical protein
MSDTEIYEEFSDREEIRPRVRPTLEAKREDYGPPQEGYTVTITTVEHHNEESEAMSRLRNFDGDGLNWVRVTKGNKVVAEKPWSHFSDKHGSRLVDGKQHKIRVLVED